MRAEDKSATERELEQRLRESQDETASLRAKLHNLATLAAIVSIAFAVALGLVVMLAVSLERAGDSAYWSQRAAIFYRGEAARGCRRRDWVMPRVGE